MHAVGFQNKKSGRRVSRLGINRGLRDMEKPEMTPGEKYFQAHQDGGRLSLKQAVLANCAACMSFWADGRDDCKMPECPLYHWQPYRDKSADVKRPSNSDGSGLRKWRESQCQK